MPALAPVSAPALRLEEPSFSASIVRYVSAVGARFGIRRADVKDVSQEALLKIIASSKTYQPEKGEFDQWARGVAFNVIRSHARGARRAATIFCDEHPNAENYPALEPSPEWCTRRSEARGAISNAAENLSGQQVQVLVLYVVDDMSHNDIGDELHISESASQKCYQRARKHLARCLKNELLATMPPSLTSCDEPISFHEKDSRWSERSHYIGQITGAVMAVFFALLQWTPPTMSEPTTTEGRLVAVQQNAPMYRLDEPLVLRDAPSGKPDPAQMTSVRDVPTPSKHADKLPPGSEYVPRLSHKHKPMDPDRRPNGR